MNFKYKITSKQSGNLVAVFDDGEKTFLKFEKLPKRLASLFVKVKGKKGLSLVNYQVRENCYVMSGVADEIELRISDKEIVKIKNRK